MFIKTVLNISLSQLNLVHILTHYVIRIQFNIISSYMSKNAYSRRSVAQSFLDQNCCHIFLTHASCPSNIMLAELIISANYDSSVCSLLHSIVTSLLSKFVSSLRAKYL
jgi:hypothetical protein